MFHQELAEAWQEGFDAQAGWWEFGHWHTPFREGLVPQRKVRPHHPLPRIPPRQTQVPSHDVTPAQAVEALPVGSPRQAQSPTERRPEPVPTPKGSGGSKKKRRGPPRESGGPLVVALGRWQHGRTAW
jgi:hypothetical protein